MIHPMPFGSWSFDSPHESGAEASASPLDSGTVNDPIPAGPSDGMAPDGRKRLLMVAMRQMAQAGFDGVTVRAIAREAGVSPGLIKHHFGSKEGLRDAVDAYFLQRSGAAMERGIVAAREMDARAFAEFERAWLLKYANEWPDFVAYLRRAILENSEWSQRLFRRYLDSVRHGLDRLDVDGQVRADVDRLWLPLLYLFMQLGPLMLEPHIRALLGRSTYEPDSWARYQEAVKRLLLHGIAPPAP